MVIVIVIIIIRLGCIMVNGIECSIACMVEMAFGSVPFDWLGTSVVVLSIHHH